MSTPLTTCTNPRTDADDMGGSLLGSVSGFVHGVTTMHRLTRLATLTVLAYASLCGTSGDRYARLLPAIEQVESSGNQNAVGDKGKAVGILQIHTVMVDDVNRIAGERRWTYADRLDADKSRAMFRTYSDHYSRNASDEVVSRRWNGGPRGDRKPATVGYWNRVRTAMEAK